MTPRHPRPTVKTNRSGLSTAGTKRIESPKPAPRAPVAAALRQPVEQWPIERRRRLMWGLVLGVMTVVVLGWAMNLGNELRQTGRPPNILTDLAQLFRTVKLPPATTSSANDQEIRQLERRVFPQFQP